MFSTLWKPASRSAVGVASAPKSLNARSNVSAAAVVRSALVEHWDADGWRVLRYTGVAAGRPVNVLFALDAAASSATVAEPVVRVTVLDEEAVPAPA